MGIVTKRCGCGVDWWDLQAYEIHLRDVCGLRLAPMLTDNQLRAECERRGIPTSAASSLLMDVRRTGERIASVNRDYADMRADRDEWKRRAEAAEVRAELLALGPFPGRTMTFTPPSESGPGIAATPPIKRDALDEATLLDLLADDAS